MKTWINNVKNKIGMPYVVLLATVLLLEVFVFNFSTWKTVGCEPIVLAQDVNTDETGVFTTGFVEIHDDVKNINVDLRVERYDRAEVTVSLTDAGDYYAYEMPAYTVTNDVKNCGYQNLYPFGTVNSLQVTVTVPQGTEASIESIALNVGKPFEFKILRVLVLFAFGAFGYIFASPKGSEKSVCNRKDKKQVGIITVVVLCLIILAALLSVSNPVCVNSPWPHHRQYQELARALKNGTVVIGEEPDAALMAKDNPYDTSALLAEGIPFRMDYAYYDGHYYAYFGIVPELLFYLPYHLITGGDLPNYIAVFALYCGLLVGVFGSLWELIHRCFKKVSFLTYLMLSVSVSLLPHYVCMVARPDIYNVPVMAGNAFIWLGAFSWLKAKSDDVVLKYKPIWYGFGAICIAAIMGCRPQMILYGVLLFGILIFPDAWKMMRARKCNGKNVIAFAVPFLVVGIIVFWYNYARFGSGFSFGASYSLTSNDMNNRGFNMARILDGLYAFIFQPPVLNVSYPFLESTELASDYMGKNIYEFSYGGMLLIYPLLGSLFYALDVGRKTFSKELKSWVYGFCIVSLIVASFDITAAGILQRYMCDMALGFALAAAVTVMFLLNRYAERCTIISWINKGAYICVCMGLIVSFLVVITSADNICLQTYNPKLFYEIASYFKF